jgi:hypothetical protein
VSKRLTSSSHAIHSFPRSRSGFEKVDAGSESRTVKSPVARTGTPGTNLVSPPAVKAAAKTVIPMVRQIGTATMGKEEIEALLGFLLFKLLVMVSFRSLACPPQFPSFNFPLQSCGADRQCNRGMSNDYIVFAGHFLALHGAACFISRSRKCTDVFIVVSSSRPTRTRLRGHLPRLRGEPG